MYRRKELERKLQEMEEKMKQEQDQVSYSLLLSAPFLLAPRTADCVSPNLCHLLQAILLVLFVLITQLQMMIGLLARKESVCLFLMCHIIVHMLAWDGFISVSSQCNPSEHQTSSPYS